MRDQRRVHEVLADEPDLPFIRPDHLAHQQVVGAVIAHLRRLPCHRSGLLQDDLVRMRLDPLWIASTSSLCSLKCSGSSGARSGCRPGPAPAQSPGRSGAIGSDRISVGSRATTWTRVWPNTSSGCGSMPESGLTLCCPLAG